MKLILIILLLLIEINSCTRKSEETVIKETIVEKELISNTNIITNEIVQETIFKEKDFELDKDVKLSKKQKDYLLKKYNKDKLDNLTLYDYYFIFRINNLFKTNLNIFIKDKNFYQGLSNEFFLSAPNIQNSLSNAINIYNNLLLSDNNNSNFYLQRIGITQYKLKKYSEAIKILNQVYASGYNNPELLFYLSLLNHYYKKQPDIAYNFIKNISNEELLIHKQDFLYFYSDLLYSIGKYNESDDILKESFLLNPIRFCSKYNIVINYLAKNDINKASYYLKLYWKYISEIQTKDYEKKVFLSQIYFNQLQKRETFIIDFEYPESIKNINNLYYYYKFPDYIEIKIAENIPIPLPTIKKTKTDKVYIPFYEDLKEINNNNYIFLVMAMVDNLSLKYRLPKKNLDTTRNIASNTTIMLINPDIKVDTNNISNIIYNNIIFITNIPEGLYYKTIKQDIDNNNIWDYVIFNINTNYLDMIIFYPDKLKIENYKLPFDNDKYKLVIQDIDNNGSKEILWINNKVNFIKYSKIP